MKIFDPQNYPNKLDQIQLGYNEIESEILSFKLSFDKLKDYDVEWKMSPPSFIMPFYDYLVKNRSIPTQEAYGIHYLNMNKGFFEEKKYDEKTNKALKARLDRTYPSLVRDVHFALYVKSKSEHSEVIYNEDLDLKEGIDLLIVFYEKFYAVNLYTDTGRAHAGRYKKKFRHIPFDNVNYIELPVKLKDANKKGDFFLYGENEFNRLLAEIRTIHKKKGTGDGDKEHG